MGCTASQEQRTSAPLERRRSLQSVKSKPHKWIRHPSTRSSLSSNSMVEQLDCPIVDAEEVTQAHFYEGRDFVVMLDRSRSMKAKDVAANGRGTCRRWDNVHTAVVGMAQQAMKYDREGIDMYLFSETYVKYEGLVTKEEVLDVMNGATKPKGNANLATVLDVAFEAHFAKKRVGGVRKPTTILVVTDGEVTSRSSNDVVSAIVNASNRCSDPTELSVSFVQVGDDDNATSFLRRLDDNLACKYDIVDTLKDDCLTTLSFEELIHLSVTD